MNRLKRLSDIVLMAFTPRSSKHTPTRGGGRYTPLGNENKEEKPTVMENISESEMETIAITPAKPSAKKGNTAEPDENPEPKESNKKGRKKRRSTKIKGKGKEDGKQMI
eukprot:GCRY01005993.1.p1 GENE.GCRY01005993.1~~GCRY01005993.1.p1  ORF type:complete len:109 (-),score=13.71 GCRY01005993.1:557-883(-)